MDRGAIVNVSLLSAFQATAMFHAFLPDLRELRHADDLGDVRAAELTAAAAAIGVGIGVSLLVRSPDPLVGAGIATAAMLGAYEYAAQTGPVHPCEDC